MRGWPVAALVMVAAGLAAQAPKRVTLDDATIRRLGVASAPAKAAQAANDVTGFARVLDPVPLAQLDADIATAAATARASQAEAGRSNALYAADATVSRKVAQAAVAQAQGDAAKLALLRRRVGLEWGPALARLGDGQRAALVAALSSGRAALVRIDSAGGVGIEGLRTATLDIAGIGTASAVILGPARTADPRLQSPGLIARVSGPRAGMLASGLTMPAHLAAAAPAAGVILPFGALIRIDGATWVYVQAGAGTFDRRRLAGVLPRGGGVFVQGVGPGERVVTHGAAQLLTAERGGGEAD